jgi:hypothetical protein
MNKPLIIEDEAARAFVKSKQVPIKTAEEASQGRTHATAGAGINTTGKRYENARRCEGKAMRCMCCPAASEKLIKGGW